MIMEVTITATNLKVFEEGGSNFKQTSVHYYLIFIFDIIFLFVYIISIRNNSTKLIG